MPTPRKAPSRPRPAAKAAKKPAKAAKPPARRPAPSTKAPAKKPAPSPAKGKPARPPSRGASKSSVPLPEPAPVRIGGRTHMLSLSFLRDGDEFMARLETDSGQITELKNRFLDQLLSLVANELEDLLE
jgi:hypothetical protein